MNKQKRYEQIRTMYEPIVKMKDYAMHQIVQTGKKMGSWRYLMIPVLFIFLFVFHFSYHLCIQLKMKEKLARGVALAMTVVMVFTSVDISAFAVESIKGQTEESEQQVITGFTELPGEVVSQVLPTGAAFEDIVFPEEVTAQVLRSEEDDSRDSDAEPKVTKEPEATIRLQPVRKKLLLRRKQQSLRNLQHPEVIRKQERQKTAREQRNLEIREADQIQRAVQKQKQGKVRKQEKLLRNSRQNRMRKQEIMQEPHLRLLQIFYSQQ